MGKPSRRASSEAELVAGLVHRFLDEYAPSRTQSEHTLRSYRTALVLYLRYLESLGVTSSDLSRTDFERSRIEGWIGWLRGERGNSNDTCNNRLGSIRAFLDYAGSREPGMLYLSAEASKIRRLPSDGAKVEGMSRAAVQAMLAAPDTSTPIGRRDLTFLMVMYSTACRLDEVRSLTAGQVRLDGGRPHVVVHGKGNKTRTCFLLPKAASVLRAYMLETMGPRPDPDSLLFPSSHSGGVMSEEAWAKRVKIHARTARETCPEVPEDAHCHQLRHFVAGSPLWRVSANPQVAASGAAIPAT